MNDHATEPKGDPLLAAARELQHVADFAWMYPATAARALAAAQAARDAYRAQVVVSGDVKAKAIDVVERAAWKWTRLPAPGRTRVAWNDMVVASLADAGLLTGLSKENA